MATRKPLVRIGGKNQQLPAADSLDVPGARFHEGDTEPTIKSYGDRWLHGSMAIEYTWVDPGVWVDLNSPTDADIASVTHAATGKTTPVDADEMGLADSEDAWSLKKLTWANIKTALSAFFVGKAGNQSIAGDLLIERESGAEVDFGVRGYAVGPVIHGYMANGTKASPTSITSGQLIFGIGSRPYAGTGFTAHSTSAIHMVSTENHSGTNQGTDFRILVTPVGKTEADRITAVRYYAPANGLRIRHRMHGTDTDRAKYQTDVDGENTSFIVIPATSGLASNVQVRSSDTADFSRGYIQATNTAVELISDAGGSGTVRPWTFKVGATTTQTHNTDGSITHQAGTRLGSDAPSLRIKKLTGTTSGTAGATTSIAHGLTGANIRGIIVEVRPAADPTQGFPPGVSFASPNRQYEAFFGGSNIAITTHPTNSSAILSSAITVLVIYEV